MDDLIDGLIEDTKRRVKKLEKKLYETVLDHFTGELDIQDKKIKIGGNVKVVESLWKAITRSLEKDLILFAKFVFDSIEEIFNETTSQTKDFDPRAVAVSEIVKETVMESAKRSIEAQTDLSVVFSNIKLKSVSLMSKYEGVSLKELRDALKKQIVVDGAIAKYWDRWTRDIYSQYQRAGANEIRKELGLKHAMYEGGLIDSSRAFCEEKNGQVFTEEEIKKWANEDWQGKNEGYVPELDCGGINCRHRLRWISPELAEQLRPDLKNK